MKGPYRLTSSKIDEVVTRTSPGNYALTRRELNNGTFIVNYVGRSDDDVGGRLKNWASGSNAYKMFKFSYASSPKAAFEKECGNYHDFGGKSTLDNENHPQRPKGTSWKCPKCSIY